MREVLKEQAGLTLKTIGETTLVYAMNHLLMGKAEQFGISLGHGRIPRENADKAPQTSSLLGTAVMVAGVIPIVEELAFRKAPSVLVDRFGLNARKVGAISSLAFGAVHMGSEAIPIPQGISGAHYWNLQQRRGYGHAALAHATHNTLMLLEAYALTHLQARPANP